MDALGSIARFVATTQAYDRRDFDALTELYDEPITTVFELRDAMIVCAQDYRSRDDALAATEA